jgi:predicted pyridoxine 5'-phosphate oxidase superfamily flavin-nucleotide-binding protein
MAKLTEDMKTLVANQQAFIATASPEGIPNIGPKGSVRVLDDEHIVFFEMTGRRTYENLKTNPNIAIAVLDREKMQGYRFVGEAELVTEGELYQQAKQMAEAMKLPTTPQAAVKVKVNEIYNIGVPEPGKKVA